MLFFNSCRRFACSEFLRVSLAFPYQLVTPPCPFVVPNKRLNGLSLSCDGLWILVTRFNRERDTLPSGPDFSDAWVGEDTS